MYCILKKSTPQPTLEVPRKFFGRDDVGECKSQWMKCRNSPKDNGSGFGNKNPLKQHESLRVKDDFKSCAVKKCRQYVLAGGLDRRLMHMMSRPITANHFGTKELSHSLSTNPPRLQPPKHVPDIWLLLKGRHRLRVWLTVLNFLEPSSHAHHLLA